MSRKLSKFEFESFVGGYDSFAVSAQRYTKQEAIEIYIREMMFDKDRVEIGVCDAFVRYRAGMTEDQERQVGWWLEYSKNKRSCPVYAFHMYMDGQNKRDEYEYLTLIDGTVV